MKASVTVPGGIWVRAGALPRPLAFSTESPVAPGSALILARVGCVGRHTQQVGELVKRLDGRLVTREPILVRDNAFLFFSVESTPGNVWV